jgi:DNA mismatch repair protein MutL
MLPRCGGRTAGHGARPRPSLWQLHDTWILAETRTGLLIIDQHSAHERILFQQWMEAFDRGGSRASGCCSPSRCA